MPALLSRWFCRRRGFVIDWPQSLIKVAVSPFTLIPRRCHLKQSSNIVGNLKEMARSETNIGGNPTPNPPPPQRPDKGQLRISENLRETYENLQQPWRIPGHGYGCPGMDKNLRNHVKFQSDPIWIPVTLKRILKTPRTNAEREGCGVWNSLISQ